MNPRTQSDKQSMTPLQRQAVLVCVVCALAALLTIGITLTLLKRGKGETPAVPDADSVTTDAPAGSNDLADHYQIDNTSSALLTETADAGQSYQDETLFLGDSNTVRLYNNGLISLQQFCAKEGIGTQVALHEGIVTFKKDGNSYTIAQAVAMMKPRRVVITLGTNDTGMEVADFISNYTALVQAIRESYPYTDIIVNTIPPIPADHSTYPHMDQAKIDDMNMALLSMCEQLGLKFLNTAETLKGDDGYGKADYYTSGDIHLKSAGLKAALNYLRTHACETTDNRPDTNNIPIRTLEYVSNPSSAVQAPSSEAASESTSSSVEAVHYEARYQVDKNGGTLASGNESGKTSLSYSITDASQTVSVTAVPAEGHVFVKWSDGVTSKTRTDTKFKQNLDVTAVFAAVSVEVSSEGKGLFGGSYIFHAKISGKYASSDTIRWYANGEEVKAAAGQTTVSVPASSVANGSYKVYAVVTYNDCKVSSNTLTLTVSGEAASSSSSHSSASSSSSSGSSSSSSSGASSGSTSSSSGNSEEKPASSSSSSHSAAESASSSSEHSSSSASSASESKSESKAESASESKREETASSHSVSKAESESKAENDLPASSTAENTETEGSASR